MITNAQSGTNVAEIAPGIYRVNTPVPIPGLPGGLLHPHETAESAAVRHLEEKAGVAADKGHATPRANGNLNTQSCCVHIDDADAHCARARAAGAKIIEPPTTHDYGDDYWADKSYECADPEGHRWWFMERIRG